MSSSHGATAGATPAPYGKACLNCAKAKCRCIYQTDRSRCQRCHRLDKECTPSVSVRKRRPGRLSTSRTSRLEEKLDDLVSLLRTQGPDQAKSSSDTNTTQDPDTTATPGTPWSSHSEDEESRRQGQDSSHASAPKPGFAPSSPREVLSHVYDRCFTSFHPHEARNQPPPSLSAQFEISPAAAEEHFATFRDKMLINFPFVYFPPETTAAELRRTSPFLWFNINIVTTQERQRQLSMATHMKHYISQAMVVANEKRFEFLQGLMIYLAWPQYYYNMKPGHSVITGLAMSLVFDLGLNRDPASLPKPLELPCMKRVSPSSSDKRTLNERRAVLGLFYLLSQISFTWKKIEIPSWSWYMDDCMAKLSQGAESDNDHVLVALVQSQLIIHQTIQPTGSFMSMSSTFIPTLQTRIRTIRDQLPAPVRDTAVITSHLLYADLVTQESVLFKSAAPPSSACPPPPAPASVPSPNNHSSDTMAAATMPHTNNSHNNSHLHQTTPVPTTRSWVPDYARHTLFVAHRDTIKAWFDWFLTLPTLTYGHVTTVVSCAMTHFLVCLYRLTMLRNADDPSWDPGLLLPPPPPLPSKEGGVEGGGGEDEEAAAGDQHKTKKTKKKKKRIDPDLDLLEVCDRMIIRLEESGKESGRMDDREFWRKGVRMIASLRQGWAAEIQQQRQQYGESMDVDGGGEGEGEEAAQQEQQHHHHHNQQGQQYHQNQHPQQEQQDMTMVGGGNVVGGAAGSTMGGGSGQVDGLAGLDVMLGTEPTMIGFEFMDYESLLPDLFYAS